MEPRSHLFEFDDGNQPNPGRQRAPPSLSLEFDSDTYKSGSAKAGHRSPEPLPPHKLRGNGPT